MAEVVDTARKRCFALGDVFVLILEDVLRDIDHWAIDAIRRGNLRRVSVQWKATLDGYPCLWTHIFICRHMRRDYMERVFSAGGAMPRTVMLSLDLDPHIPDTVKVYSYPQTVVCDPAFLENIAGVFETYASTIVKLAVATISRTEWNTFVDALRHTSFPSLTSFGIAANKVHRRRMARALRPLRGIPDTIRDLMFDSMPHTVISAAYTSLTSLSLSGRAEYRETWAFARRYASTASVVLRALRHCPRLITLRLSDVDYAEDEDLQPVELPLLEALGFSCGNCTESFGHSCGYLISLLDTPQLTTMAIYMAHPRGLGSFSALNRDKLRRILRMDLVGHCQYYITPTAENFFLSTLLCVVHLDITGLTRIPRVRTAVQYPQAVDAYLSFLLVALSLPDLETLRVPHTLSSYVASSFDSMQSFLAMFRWNSPRVTIVEDHARCSMRDHVLCIEYSPHVCDPHSAPHENCHAMSSIYVPCALSTRDPTRWNCADRTHHNSCARTWACVVGSIEIGITSSLSSLYS
ncbi:hypothetical protein C8F01DRAFT_1230569 [Mycena amicta]|nr:hypothetical protein C8F01DRAFT_1230569 [Mycena amicta]